MPVFKVYYVWPTPRHLVFRPYKGDIKKAQYELKDRGYYFKFKKSAVKIIRLTLEYNGFYELDKHDVS